jgi:WD40 repeat protein
LRIGTSRATVTSDIILRGPDYTTFVDAELNDAITIRDVATGKVISRVTDKNVRHDSVMAVSADGRRIVAETPFRTLDVWDAATGRQVVSVSWLRASPSFGTTKHLKPVSFSADGRLVAISERGATRDDSVVVVRVLDTERNAEVCRIRLPHIRPLVPVLSPDGTLLATWAAIGQPFNLPPEKAGGPSRPGTHSGWTADLARQVRIWDVTTGKELAMVRLEHYPAEAIVFSPDGKTLAASGRNGPIQRWDARTGKPYPAINCREEQGYRLALAPDGKTVAAMAIGPEAHGVVERWDAATGGSLGECGPPDGLYRWSALGLAFAADGRLVAWGTNAGQAVVWEVPSRKVISPVGGHPSRITGIGFAAGGKEILTAGADEKLYRWDAATGRGLGSHPVKIDETNQIAPNYRYAGMTLSPDAARGLMVRGRGMFDPRTGATAFTIPVAEVDRFSTSWTPSPDYKQVAAISRGRMPMTATVKVWDAEARKTVAEFTIPATGPFPEQGAAFSPDGSRLVTILNSGPAGLSVKGPSRGQAQTIMGWDVGTGKKTGEFVILDGWSVDTLAVADNTWVVTHARDGRVWAVNYAGGREAQEVGKARAAGPIAISPDGKRIAVGFRGEEPRTFGVQVYKWPERELERTFVGHTAAVGVLTFSPDGKTLASGSADTTVLLWDLTAPGK